MFSLFVGVDDFKVDTGSKKSLQTRIKIASGLDQVVDLGFVGRSGCTIPLPGVPYAWVPVQVQPIFKEGHIRTHSILQVRWDLPSLIVATTPLGALTTTTSADFLKHVTDKVTVSDEGGVRFIYLNNN